MLIGMVFGRLGGVVVCVQTVAVGYLGMMCSFLVITGLVVFCGSAVMLGRVFVMLRGFVMMVYVVFGHGILS